MDNICVFNDWKVQSIRIAGDEKKKRVELICSTRRANKDGIWNKNYFTAFEKNAELLEKLNVVKGTIITLSTTQSVYLDKQGKMQNNYIIKDFDVVSRPESTTSSTAQTNHSQVSRSSETQESTEGDAVEEKVAEPTIMDGYEAMKSFMNA